MDSWNLQPIEKAFADAAIDPTRWVDALDTATALTEGFGAILLPVTGAYPIPGVPFSDRLAESAETYFRDGWHQRDERFKGVPLMMSRGAIDDLDLADIDTINRHPYYQEFLAPLGLRWFAGIRIACGEDVWCLSIQRTIKQGPFLAHEKHQLASLSDRLSSSAALARAIGSASADGALDAFEMSGTAVVLINRHGEVYKANQSAERLLNGDVFISARKLVAKDEHASAALDRALSDLIWRRDESALSVPVLLPREGQRPLLAYAAKLSRLTSNVLWDCQCAVVLIDPDKRSRPLETTLQSSFRLTQAEARLASRLASGEALATVADELGITKETSRTQLKNVFTKTGTHRQAELVALLTPLLWIV